MQDIFVGDKRAGPLMTSTFALIVFAILAVVILIVFWDLESGSFSRAFSDFVEGENVEGLIDECNNFADKSAFYNYCCVQREVKHKEGSEKIIEKMTCRKLEKKSFVSGRIDKLNCDKFEC